MQTKPTALHHNVNSTMTTVIWPMGAPCCCGALRGTVALRRRVEEIVLLTCALWHDGARQAERLLAELAELERTAARQGARIARLQEEASAVAEVIGSGARQIEDLIARQDEACAREIEALGHELAPFRAPHFQASLRERRLRQRAAREARRRGELLLRQARGNATEWLDFATMAAVEGLRAACSEVIQTAEATAAQLHVEVAPAAAEVLAAIESFKGAAVREEKCQVQHLGWLRANLPKPVAVKKRCANRDLYTAWAGCDQGWSGVTFEKCMSLCATNALPRGCHGVPPDATCAFAVWFSSSGLCHLAKACVLEDSHPDAEVWAAGGQLAAQAECPWAGARGGWWHGGRPLASAEVLNVSDPSACREACCIDHPGCEAFTWWRASGACHLHQSVRGATWIQDLECTSDVKLSKLADLPAQPFADVRPMFALTEPVGDECPINLAHRGFDGHLGGAFSFMCTVRMDHRNAWSRIFDFSVAPDTQSISAGSVDDSLDLHFTVYRAWSRLSTVVVPDFFELGKETTVLFAVSGAGRLSVFRDGLLVGREDGHTPRWTFRPHLIVGGQSGGHHNYTGQGFRGTIRGIRVWAQEVTWPSRGAAGSLLAISRLDDEHYCAVVRAERVGIDQVAVEYRSVGGASAHGVELPTNSTLSWEGGLAQVYSSADAGGSEPWEGLPAGHAAGVLTFSGVPLAGVLTFEYGCVGYPPVRVAVARDSAPERGAASTSDPAGDSEGEAAGAAAPAEVTQAMVPSPA
ncbi:unnamed protein product [Prorocentrum cordatum]|uniref:Apple domain-containing protein n=1 Tax=Prorocentrum cordatum TaxID=2364126 RepID=A0ABN9X9I4_9DINO|nr:unnamed protein product [Polarella glacialis]